MVKYTESQLEALVNQALGAGLDEPLFIFELDHLWEWLGYATKGSAVRSLAVAGLTEGLLFNLVLFTFVLFNLVLFTFVLFNLVLFTFGYY